VDAAEDEAEGLGVWIRQHHELVPRERFVQVELIRGRAVIDKLLIPACEALDHVAEGDDDAVHELRLLIERKRRGRWRRRRRARRLEYSRRGLAAVLEPGRDNRA